MISYSSFHLFSQGINIIRIYVADECNNRISLFSADGEEWMGHVLTKEDGLAFPHAVSVFSDGAIAVADDNKVVKVYRGIN